MNKVTGEIGDLPNARTATNPCMCKTSADSSIEPILDSLRQYLIAVPFLRIITDTDRKILLINPAACESLGCAPNSVMGQDWVEQFTPIDLRPDVLSIFDRLVSGDTNASCKYKMQTTMENGQIKSIEWLHVPLMDSSGNVVGIVCSGEDVTLRERTEETARQSHETTRTILEKLPMGILVVGRDRVVRDINETALAIVGRKRDEVVGHKCYDIMSVTEKGKCPILDLGENIESDQRKVLDSNGKRITILKTVIPISLNGEDVLLEAFLDITERRRAEEALRESYKIINKSPAVAFLWQNAEGWPVEYVSENVKELLGYSAEEFMTGKVSYENIIHPEDLERVGNEVAQASKSKERMSFQHEPYRIITKGGQVKWVNDGKCLRKDKSGEITHYQGIVLDITKGKKAEDERLILLSQLNERHKELICMFGVTEAVRKHEDLTDILQHVATIVPTGWHHSEIARCKIWLEGREYISEPFDESEWKLTAPIVSKGEVCGSVEVCYIEERPEMDEEPFLAEERSLIDSVAGVLGDAIEIKQTEDALRDNEDRLSAILNHTTAVVYMKDLAGRYTFINRRFGELFNVTIEEVLGKTDHNVFPKEMADIFRENDLRVLAEDRPLELEEVAPHCDGPHSYISVKFPMYDGSGQAYAVCGMSTDITDNKRAERQVIENEEKFRALFESSSDAVMLLDESGFFDCNGATLKMFGYENREEFCSYHPADISPPNQPDGTDSMVLSQRHIQTAMEEGKANFNWVYQRTDGRSFHAEVLLNRVIMSGKQIIQAVLRDISYRIKSEDEYARTVSQYLAMINTVPAQTFLKDLDGRYILANEALCESIGKPLSEIIGKTNADLSEYLDASTQHKHELQVMKEDKTISKQDCRSVDIDGQETWTSTTIVPLHDDQGVLNGVVGLIQDITELHQSREQLVQADKMAAIGTLSAGVAHEINNPVGFISSNLNTMGKYLVKIRRYSDEVPQPNAEAREALTEMLDDFADAIDESKEGAERVRKIVSDLKSFSRVDRSQKEYFNLNDGLETTLNIVWNELKYKCTVDKYLGEIPNLYCMPNQLNQVFMNLLVNAGQAITADSGTITITTSADEKNIYVSIRDTGMGIPRENLNRIFEPFFTTKDVGKGTGLGLSMAYDIVQKHSGRISIKSEAGSGTEFIVTLPLEGLKSSEAQNPDS